MSASPLIFCAIDTHDLSRALELSKIIGPVTGGLKLGLEFFCTHGPQGVEKIREACPAADIFLDLKFHDIPNTVAASVKSISENLAPEYLNVHASGSTQMLSEAKNACARHSKLLAVTILTSLDKGLLPIFGVDDKPLSIQVHLLAGISQKCGLDGIVCSGHEIKLIREDEDFKKDFILMVPGIRPEGSSHNDQQRVMTPKGAIEAGATHLVIGRPITQAKDPALAAREILDTL